MDRSDKDALGETGGGPKAKADPEDELADGPERRRPSALKEQLALAGPRRGKVARAVARSLEMYTEIEAAKLPRREGPVTKIRKRGRQHPVIEVDQLDSTMYAQPLPKSLQRYADVLVPMPRRKQRTTRPINIDTPPLGAKIVFEASLLQTLGRLIAWISALVTFFSGVLWDKLRRQDSEERRAQRLLQAIQRTGGTLVKIGQQLAMRVDVLPYAYCRELAKLFDAVKPFPTEKAIERIEASIGMPLNEAFSVFDPVPIGSASIACVYQAVLQSGQKVAVKVRRPDAARLFAADIKAMNWMLTLTEALTFVRPGVMRNFLIELEGSLGEELDFRREARHQELVRRYAKKKRLNSRPDWFTAPKVYAELSSADVLVQEFCSGVWAWEVIAAVEHKDQEILARMRRLNIDPEVVAKRLTFAGNWQVLTHFLFHADPHPANILVREDNEIVFIDFGACGLYDTAQRGLLEEMQYHQANKDVYGMVQAILAMLEPLPHIDINEFEKELQLTLWGAMCKVWNKKSPWHERTTASIWLSLFELSRKYQLPVNLDTVRMFRSNMLFDSLALRLWNDLNIYDEYHKFGRLHASVIAKELKRKTAARVRRGLRDEDYASIAKMLDLGKRATFEVRRALNRKHPNFAYMIEKSVFSVLEAIQAVSTSIALFVVSCAMVTAGKLVAGQEVRMDQIALSVWRNLWFQGAVALILLTFLRRILFRLNDRKIS